MSQAKLNPPSLKQLEILSDLCSDKEWQELSSASGFIDATCRDLSETENFMSFRLGRKISLSQPSVKNPGDESL